MNSSVLTRDFDAFRAKIQSPTLQAIADHWQEARGERRMPPWADIQPACIAPHLTRIWSFKYDRVTGEFTARLAGNQIMLGFGLSFRGTPLREIHPPHVFEKVQANLTRVVLGPNLHRSAGRLFRQGNHVISGERIVLPLASDGIHGDGALGASDYPAPPQSLEGLEPEVIHDVEEWFAFA
jgi:hypothetical protein